MPKLGISAVYQENRANLSGGREYLLGHIRASLDMCESKLGLVPSGEGTL
jgi:hypothetical protein